MDYKIPHIPGNVIKVDTACVSSKLDRGAASSTQPYMMPGGVIKKGTKDDGVLNLQKNLIASGDYHGITTGTVDDETLLALQSFVDKLGIKVKIKDYVPTSIYREVEKKATYMFKPIGPGESGPIVTELTTHLLRWGAIDDVKDQFDDEVGQAVRVFRLAAFGANQTVRTDPFVVDSRGLWGAIHGPVRDNIQERIYQFRSSRMEDSSPNTPDIAIPKSVNPQAFIGAVPSDAQGEATPPLEVSTDAPATTSAQPALKQGEKKPFYKNPWFWGSVILGVAALSSDDKQGR